MMTNFSLSGSKSPPVSLNLDGWGEQVNENIDEYDEIFNELHDKYKMKAKID